MSYMYNILLILLFDISSGFLTDSEFGLDEDDDTDEYEEEYEDENDSDFNCGSKNREKASNRKPSTPKPKKQIKTKGYLTCGT